MAVRVLRGDPEELEGEVARGRGAGGGGDMDRAEGRRRRRMGGWR